MGTIVLLFMLVVAGMFVVSKFLDGKQSFTPSITPKVKLPPFQEVKKDGPYRTAGEIFADPSQLDKPKPAVIEYSNPYVNYECPKCGMSWHLNKGSARPYCECDVIDGGHFHFICNSHFDGKKGDDSGCFAPFIMKEKDNK